MGFNMSAGVLKELITNLLTTAVSTDSLKAPLKTATDFLEQTGLFQDQVKYLKREVSAKVLERQFQKLIMAIITNNKKEGVRIINEFLEQSGFLRVFQDFVKEVKLVLSAMVQEEELNKFITAIDTKNTKEGLEIIKAFLIRHGQINLFQDQMKNLKQVIEFLQLVQTEFTPSRTIHSLSKAGKIEEVTSLVQTNVKINDKDVDGQTPLHYAAYFGHLKVAKLLLEKGAKYNARNGIGATPLQLAKSSEIGKVLLTVKGLFEDVRTGNGEKVLQHISEEGCIVNIRDKTGCTALHWATLDGHKHIVKLLLEFGADATLVSDKSNSPLHIAASKGHREIIQLLLQSVSRDRLHDFVNGKTETGGNTPLHAAAERGFTDSVRTLLSYGAVFSVRNKRGKTPLELAKEWSCCNLLKLIEELFQDAKEGRTVIIGKLRDIETPDLVVISKARDVGNFTLMQVAFNAKHHNLARMLVKVLKDSYLN